MRRREFISLLGVAATAWPLAARAQQPQVPVIGFLHGASPGPFAHLVTAFVRGLNDAGFVDGRDIAIEYRWAEGQYERLQPMAADLVRRHVAVIVTAGGTPSALAAKAATSTIPTLFSIGSDPVKLGLVASLNRPSGNITGINVINLDLAAKRLEVLHELAPNASEVGLLVNPTNAYSGPETEETREAARKLGLKFQVLNASSQEDIDREFASFSQRRINALLLGADPWFISRRDQLASLALSHMIPAMFAYREFVETGGLVSYSASIAQSYRQLGIYAARILKGEKPSDLPVLQPTKFELVINLKTAKALGLDVPPTLLARADEVIE